MVRDIFCDCRFPGARPARDSDDQRFQHPVQSYAADDWNALCRPSQHSNRCLLAGSAMKIKSIAIVLFVAAIAACSSLSRGSGAADQSQPTVLQVENLGFQDMD